ncbi:hypothetical protein [Halorientalis litorea]|jgi:hypothetical protein|uniref:hypothetical protein n=1 Tax=Halorientalis litorea TaxID=2931977 RepID=UPI001FF29E6C|nr:hypothetical protein [Halorientalis litorea]
MDKSGAGREIVRRRAFISGIATATVGVAGCLGVGDDTPTAETSDGGSPAAERTTTGGGASAEPELSIPVRGG